MPRKSALPFSQFILVTLVTSAMVGCDKETPQVQLPDAVITSVSPTTGEPGTRIKIRGTNFHLPIVAVTFRGVAGHIMSTSDSLIEVVAPSGTGTGPIELTMKTKTITGPEFGYHHVYYYGRHNSAAVYWKGTDMFTIEEGSIIEEMVMSGNDLHAIGATTIGAFTPTYWKNGVSVPLEGTTPSTFLTGIAVSGNDVHICGISQAEAPVGWIAKYWKNGKLESEIIHEGGTLFYDLLVNGNDIFIAGSSNPQATIWKNGVATPLPSGPPLSVATKVKVIGSDVHVIGADENGFGTVYKARYWKNGADVPLSNNDKFFPIDFVLKENEPMMVGFGYTGDNQTQPSARQYFKGQVTGIHSFTNDYASAIEIRGTHQYVLLNANGFHRHYYYFHPGKNGGELRRDGEDVTPEHSQGFTGGISGFFFVPY